MRQYLSSFKLNSGWESILSQEMEKPYFSKLIAFLEEEKRKGSLVYPPENLVFNALNLTPFDRVKVVIMGQDPYHGAGQAEGLSFSVARGVSPPPSLRNIFKELHNDLKISPPTHGSLYSWAEQGVLMLNATLTVRAGEPKSHFGQGWEQLTSVILEKLLARKSPIIFVLWGKSAKEKYHQLFFSDRHKVLTAPHPSPFSAHLGFFGSSPFSQINSFLKSIGESPIQWEL